jgi:hypothetical protein
MPVKKALHPAMVILVGARQPGEPGLPHARRIIGCRSDPRLEASGS